jgi:putative membrane protein
MKHLKVGIALCAAMALCAQSVADRDRSFIEKAAKGGMQEVHIGKKGVDGATDAQVKAYAQKIVDAHTKANEELKSLAQKKGIQWPSEQYDAAMDKSLSATKGADFDRQFVHLMISDHEKDIAMFEDAAKNASDPDLRQWANKMLPDLRKHLADAKSLGKH